MTDEITTVKARGKDSSSRQTARMNASGKLGHKLHDLGMMPVGDPWWELHPVLHGRFEATAYVKARPRR